MREILGEGWREDGDVAQNSNRPVLEEGRRMRGSCKRTSVTEQIEW